MNYQPFVGFWFYGATTPTERASYSVSYGLIQTAPILGDREIIKIMGIPVANFSKVCGIAKAVIKRVLRKRLIV